MFLKSVLFFFLISAALFFIIDSNLFAIKNVMVENNSIFSEEEIVEMSGVILGTNTFKIKLKDISQRIRVNPYIKNVEIRRRLPNKLIIKVEERVEVACITFLDHCIILDGEGYVLKTVSENPNLTVIEGFEIEDFTIGKKLEIKSQALLIDALDVIMNMKDNNLFFKKIVVINDEAIVYITDRLTCRADFKVLNNKMKTLGSIVYDLHKKGIKRGVIRIEENGYYSFSPVE